MIGIVVAALAGLVRRLFKGRSAARQRELLAAQVLLEEMTAALSALDMALRRTDFKWLQSLSESRMLADAWQEHWEALGLRPADEHWEVIHEAVRAVAPTYGFASVTVREDKLKQTLMGRRERLVDATDILRVITDRQRAARTKELERLADQRRRKWETRQDLLGTDSLSEPSTGAGGSV